MFAEPSRLKQNRARLELIHIHESQGDTVGSELLHQGGHILGPARAASYRVEVAHAAMEDITAVASGDSSQSEVNERSDTRRVEGKGIVCQTRIRRGLVCAEAKDLLAHPCQILTQRI